MLKNELLYHTKWLDLKSTEFGGNVWYYTHRPNARGAAIIVPIIEEDPHQKKVVFLETYRPILDAEGVTDRCIEWVAGLIGDERIGETDLEAINAELLEETGYEAHHVKIVAKKAPASAGCLTETAVFALAYINTPQKQTPSDDNGVIVKRHFVALNQIHAFLEEKEQQGYCIQQSTYAGICFLYKYGIL